MGTIYRQGDSGSVIKQTQQALADRGLISQKDVTGTYDKTTANAIKTFKTNTNGSNTYGNTFGNETLEKLLTSSGSSSENSKTTTEYSPYQSPASVSFDSNAWKQAYIDQMVSELTSNYNTDKANLDKTYNTNITNYNNQLNDTNMSYDANIQALQRQKYDDVQQAKNESFSRGLGFGGLGQAIEQTARNNANNKIADTQNERTRAINNINTLINQATYNYGIDSDTLLKNFNADKLKYMSTAEIQALEKKLQVDMYNTDWTNKFLQDANNRTFTSSESDKKLNWQAGQNALDRELSTSEAQKDRDAQTALVKLQAKLYGSGSSGGGGYRSGYNSGYSSGSSGLSNDVLAANYLQSAGISTDNAEAKKLYWESLPEKYEGKLFYHISTDEVYGALELTNPEGVKPPFTTKASSGTHHLAYGTDFFYETTKYNPHSPYSASKASSDHFVRAFHDTYGMPTIVTNCSNNYGPYQFPEKLIPLFINNICKRKPLPVYGKGENVRDWLFVEDHARAIDTIFHNGKIADTYNIGGFNEWKNIDIIKVLINTVDRLLGRKEGEDMNLITYVTDRAGHDMRYAIDSSKLQKELGWEPSLQFEEGIEKTVKWYLENEEWMSNIINGDYEKYYDEMYKNR